MKRGNQGNDGLDNKRKRRDDDVVWILIPSRIAGAVIGKSGQHIQKLRSRYKATVSVDDCQGPERTILVSSDPQSVISIVIGMLKYFEERYNEVDVRKLIHQCLAGCVIGKGGAKIKEIQDEIGCRILKVFSNVAPQSTDRIVQVIGKSDQCVEAIREVLDLTRDTPIKGAIHNYDPVNFDDVYADECGWLRNDPASVPVRRVKNEEGPQIKPDYASTLNKLMENAVAAPKVKIKEEPLQDEPFKMQHGIEERLKNIEKYLDGDQKPAPRNLYERIKVMEDRLLYLESISPEYSHFLGERPPVDVAKRKKRQNFTVDDLDRYIDDIKKSML